MSLQQPDGVLPEKLNNVPLEQTNGVPQKQLNGEFPEKLNGVTDTALPLEELSRNITKNATTVSQYLRANHLPQPSQNSDGPSTVLPSGSPQDIQQARQKLISASLEILQLAIGPSEYLPSLATGVRLEYSSLRASCKTYS